MLSVLVREASLCSEQQFNTKTHNWSKCWKYMTVLCWIPNGTSVPLPPKLEAYSRGSRKNVTATGRGEGCETVFWTWQGGCTYELTAAVVTMGPISIPPWIAKGLTRPHHSLRSYWQLEVAGGMGVISSVVYSTVAHAPIDNPHPSSCK